MGNTGTGLIQMESNSKRDKDSRNIVAPLMMMINILRTPRKIELYPKRLSIMKTIAFLITNLFSKSRKFLTVGSSLRLRATTTVK